MSGNICHGPGPCEQIEEELPTHAACASNSDGVNVAGCMFGLWLPHPASSTRDKTFKSLQIADRKQCTTVLYRLGMSDAQIHTQTVK